MENQNIKSNQAAENPEESPKESGENLVLDTQGGVMPDPSRMIKEKAEKASEVFENQKGKPQPDREKKQEPEKKAG